MRLLREWLLRALDTAWSGLTFPPSLDRFDAGTDPEHPRSCKMARHVLALAFIASIGLVLAACVPTRVGYTVYARVPPPEPYVEVVAASPGDGYVWVDGYWHWTGDHYRWIGGHWAARPYPGYVWVSSGWVHDHGHYRFVPGRWVHHSHRPRVRYVHSRPKIRRGTRYRTVKPRGTVRARKPRR